MYIQVLLFQVTILLGSFSIREIIESIQPDVDFDVDESGWYAKDEIVLEGEDLELYNRLYDLLDEIDDVTDIYTNVKDM